MFMNASKTLRASSVVVVGSSAVFFFFAFIAFIALVACFASVFIAFIAVFAVVVAAAVFHVGIDQRQKEGKHYSSNFPVVN